MAVQVVGHVHRPHFLALNVVLAITSAHLLAYMDSKRLNPLGLSYGPTRCLKPSTPRIERDGKAGKGMLAVICGQIIGSHPIHAQGWAAAGLLSRRKDDTSSGGPMASYTGAIYCCTLIRRSFQSRRIRRGS